VPVKRIYFTLLVPAPFRFAPKPVDPLPEFIFKWVVVVKILPHAEQPFKKISRLHDIRTVIPA